jgi:hypothetical protein
MPLLKASAMAGLVVADRFAQHDDIRDNPLGLETPQVSARPSETGLDFINDAHPTGTANGLEHLDQVAGRHDDLPAHARQGFSDETGQAPALLF